MVCTQIFESRKSCEIDPAKLCEGEDIDINMVSYMRGGGRGEGEGEGGREGGREGET